MGDVQSKSRDEVEICSEYLQKGVCSLRKICTKVHHRKPYCWQIREKDSTSGWVDFTDCQCDDLEAAYCDPKLDSVNMQLSAARSSSDLIKIMGTDQWVINFAEMVANRTKLSGDDSESLLVRRASTPSTEKDPSAFMATTYKWYFKDFIGKWIEYGNSGNPFRNLSIFDAKADIDSKKIEKHYWDEKARIAKEDSSSSSERLKSGSSGTDVLSRISPLSFSTQQHEYSIDFGRMVQINLNPKFKTERSIRRRPAPHAADKLESLKATVILQETHSTSDLRAASSSSFNSAPAQTLRTSHTDLDLAKRLPDGNNKRNADGVKVNTFEQWQQEHERKRQARWAELKARGKDKPGKNDPELLATRFFFVDISPDSEEFQRVREVLKRGSKSKLLDKISSLRRVENSVLKARFEKEKENLAKKHGAGSEYVEERYLFHGTKDDRVESICRINFDLDIAGTSTGCLYGRGVYLAPTAVNATLYGSSLIVCRCLPGQWFSGSAQENWTKPPFLPNSMQRYDSVADSPKNPGVFIIFDENKIYPEYVVKLS